MLLKFFSFFIALILFFLNASNTYASMAIYTISGDNKQIGDNLNISANTSGQCNTYTHDFTVVELAMTAWAGAPQGYSIDLSNAQISATLNGSPLSGSRKYFTHPSNVANVISLHLDNPFIYKKDSTAVAIFVTGARRRYAGDSGFKISLLEQPLKDAFAYYGCNPDNDGFHYIDQAAEVRKKEGLPIDGSPMRITIISPQSVLSSQTQNQIISSSPTGAVSPSITPVVTMQINQNIKSKKVTQVENINKSVLKFPFSFIMNIVSRVKKLFHS